MATTFDNAISALNSFQRALTTVSHNIGNVNTPGYSRQRIDFSAREPDGTGNVFIGNGVEIGNISRVTDKFVVGRLRDAHTDSKYAEAFHSISSQLDGFLGDPDSGLLPALTEYFNSAQTVADEPSSLPARRVMVESAESLVQRFQYVDERLQGLDKEVRDRLTTGVAEINSMLTSLAQLNEDISAVAQRSATSTPNDFLDKRDSLLQDLAQKIGIHVIDNDDSSVSVFTKEGLPLIIGQLANQLGTQQSEYDPRRTEVIFDVGINPQIITDKLQGGELGGLIEFRDEMLDPARIKVGRLATVFAETMNSQHNKGMDLNGNLGGDLFGVADVDILPHDDNAATTTSPVITIDDATLLQTSNYILSYDGTTTTWSIERISDGTVIDLDATIETAPGSGIYVLPNDGIQIDVNGVTVSDGDKFMVRPAWRGAELMELLISAPQELAAAAPIRTRTDTGNLGTATVSLGEVIDETDVDLLDTVNIVFEDPPTTYIITDSTGTQLNDPTTGLPTSYTYTSGSDIEFFGWRIQIKGTPSADDSFTVEANTNGFGDNRNMLAVAALQNEQLMDSNQSTYQSGYAGMVGEVGAVSRQKQIEKDAQGNLLESIQQERDAVSGVSLDEEAVKLMQFQQAYQAAAQVISVTRQLIDELFQAVR